MGQRLLVRSFDVGLGLEEAWRQLQRVEDWPQWAGHITRVQHEPPGPLGPASRGRIHLRRGPRSTFRMTAFEPYRHWAWTGPFLWLKVHYDHRFEPVGDDRTHLTWIVEGEGLGVGLVGRLFAAVYGRNLDRAIPRFVAWAER